MIQILDVSRSELEQGLNRLVGPTPVSGSSLSHCFKDDWKRHKCLPLEAGTRSRFCLLAKCLHGQVVLVCVWPKFHRENDEAYSIHPSGAVLR